MKFNQIIILDDCGLTQPELELIANFSIKPLKIYIDNPIDEEEILKRIGDADAVLVSWKTQLRANHIHQFKSVKYIGLCCSLYDEKSSNVDIGAARENDIVVKGVRDYGDEGTVEFIFAQLISLFKGFGKHQWRQNLQELKGKSIGIIGLGTLGKMVADTALHFGMQVYYYNRSPKKDLPKVYQYLPLEEIVTQCDVLTTHIPKNTVVMTEEIFKIKKQNSIFINTSLGATYDKTALLKWLKNDSESYAIFDAEGCGIYSEEFKLATNIIVYPKSSGSTIEAKKRLSQKVLANIESYFNSLETDQ